MPVLVDTSVWIDHLRSGDAHLVTLLERTDVVVHDGVVGEMALGSLRHRGGVLALMTRLPHLPHASTDEVLTLVDGHRLHGTGVGWVDVHLLASTLLAPGTSLWTRDRRLDEHARSLGVAHRPPSPA